MKFVELWNRLPRKAVMLGCKPSPTHQICKISEEAASLNPVIAFLGCLLLADPS